MKLHQIPCPKCKSTLNSKAGIESGTSIACPKCKNKFTVSAPDDEVASGFEFVDEAEEAPKKKPAASKKRVDEDEEETRPAAKKRSRDEDDEETPKSKRKSRDEDDEEDKPIKKKRHREDDEDEDDKPKSGYAKAKNNPWIRGGILGGLLIIMGVLGYFLYDKYKKDKQDSAEKKAEDDLAKPIDPSMLKKFPKIEMGGDMGKKNPLPKIAEGFVCKWKFPSVEVQGENSLVVEYLANGTFNETRNFGGSVTMNSGTWQFVGLDPRQPGLMIIKKQGPNVEPTEFKVRFSMNTIGHDFLIDGKMETLEMTKQK